MGVVYKAKDPVIGRVVAVKTIRLVEEGSGLSHHELVQRFQTEARAAGLLTHPNIVTVYDAGEDGGLYYITMELVSGQSLQAKIDSGQRFRLARVLQIMEQVCSALQYAHERNVVHRDIKPANVLISADQTVKLTDFGTAKILEYGAVQQTAIMGTPGYMSPEQVKGKAIDGRSDIFSLGVMLYELTTGKRPFRGPDVASILYKILNEEPPSPQTLDTTIPTGMANVIMRAISKEPARRYQSCRALMDDLRNNTSDRPDSRAPGPTVAMHAPVASSSPSNAAPANITPQTPVAAEPKTGGFAAEMPKIPGVFDGDLPQRGAAKRFSTPKLVGIALAALIGVGAIRSLLRSKGDSPQTAEALTTVPAPVDEPTAAPETSLVNPEIASVTELGSLWSSKEFRFRDPNRSIFVSAIIVRLPGSPLQSSSYWAFSLKVPFSQCDYEYITDLDRLASEYRFQARHPMVGNPCSHAVFDPLELKELPGNIMVRGAVVHGWDTRPPFGIEVKVVGNQIRALRMEQ
jgi:eukaryotic-like serine/threonine-protein kinase